MWNTWSRRIPQSHEILEEIRLNLIRYELDNVEFISNPGVVSLDGIKVLIYHGRSFDDLVMAVKDFSYEKTDFFLKMRLTFS